MDYTEDEGYSIDHDEIWLTHKGEQYDTGPCWCEDQVAEDDVRYVNERLYSAQAARITELRAVLAPLVEASEECAGGLEAEVQDRYNRDGQGVHPAIRHKYDRDMEAVRRCTAAIDAAREVLGE